MQTASSSKPRFSRDQKVKFVGGSGVILNCQAEAGTWSYLIEMELGPEPTMGRVGNETKIFLLESDLRLIPSNI